VAEGVVIQIEKLSYTYLRGTPFQVPALNNIDLYIHRNESVGVIGPTGSGKSTLLHHMNGLFRPQQGDLQVYGMRLGDPEVNIREVRRRVGLVFQNPEDQLFEQYVGDDVAFGPRNYHRSKEEVREVVRSALSMVGLPFSFKDRLIAELSLGEKRRVALAGVFAMETEMLVLDEPTASLDPEGRRELLNILKGWRSVKGRTMVVVSHSIEDIVELADRILVMAEGRIVFDGGTRELFRGKDLIHSVQLVPPVSRQVIYELFERGFLPAENVFEHEALSNEEVAEYLGGILHARRI
jgi:energy-coupling factor transport system ATP-binding protein